MSHLFQLVLFNNCFIQLLIPWMSPLFQLVLFNFLFRWPPLFGRTFYSTTGFIQQPTAYSTFYSNGCPYLVALFIQQPFNCLFNFLFQWPPLFGRTFYSTTIQLLIQLFIPMAALIWSHFLFNNHSTAYSTFYSNGRPYLVALFIQLFIFIQLIWSPLFYPYYN